MTQPDFVLQCVQNQMHFSDRITRGPVLILALWTLMVSDLPIPMLMLQQEDAFYTVQMDIMLIIFKENAWMILKIAQKDGEILIITVAHNFVMEILTIRMVIMTHGNVNLFALLIPGLITILEIEFVSKLVLVPTMLKVFQQAHMIDLLITSHSFVRQNASNQKLGQIGKLIDANWNAQLFLFQLIHVPSFVMILQTQAARKTIPIDA